MLTRTKTLLTWRAISCLIGQTVAYLHLGSTIWINGTLQTKTGSIIPSVLTVCALAIGLLLSKPILVHFTTLKVYLFSAAITSLSFYLIIHNERLWAINIFSLSMGFFAGIAFFAPVVQSQMHLPDRPVLLMSIILASTSLGFSICCLITPREITWMYFCCVFLASILMTEP